MCAVIRDVPAVLGQRVARDREVAIGETVRFPGRDVIFQR